MFVDLMLRNAYHFRKATIQTMYFY